MVLTSLANLLVCWTVGLWMGVLPGSWLSLAVDTRSVEVGGGEYEDEDGDGDGDGDGDEETGGYQENMRSENWGYTNKE